MNLDKALVIVTGGPHSTTLLAKVVQEKGAENVTAIHFAVTPSDGELASESIDGLKWASAYRISYALNVPMYNYNLFWRTPHLRNGVYIMLASDYAKQIGAGVVYHATYVTDEHLYDDAIMDFNLPIESAVIAGSGNEVSLLMPFNRSLGTDITALAKKLQAPVQYSCSCTGYKVISVNEDSTTPYRIHCGECAGCERRIQEFRDANIFDPALYAIKINWEGCKAFNEKE